MPDILGKNYQSIVDEIDELMKGFSHIKKDIGYGWRRTFDNGMWFDLIDYKKKGTQILRIGRGVWLVKKYPVLYGLFDQVAKVIAKLEIPNTKILHEKHLIGVFKLLDEAPKGVGVLDNG